MSTPTQPAAPPTLSHPVVQVNDAYNSHRRGSAASFLQEADAVKRNHMFTRHGNHHARYSYKDLYRIRGSVVPKVFIPASVLTLWGTLWTVLYMVAKVQFFAIPTLLITVLGVVMSLLLVFRTNTAYDRYWEGRRIWGTLLTNVRNLSRFVWVSITPTDEQTTNEKIGAMNLILAFPVATKHFLRDEPGYRYTDLRHLVSHLPDMKPGAKEIDVNNLPLEISFHIAGYTARARQLNLIDAAMGTAMTNALNAMVDSLTNFERIRSSPIPLAYNVHLKQTLMLYILSLPFQLVSSLKWGTIPVMLIASFTLLGIESIGGEIENPFGYDDNDLPVEKFCEDARDEMKSVMRGSAQLDPASWGQVLMVPSASETAHTVDIPDLRQRK